MIKSIIFDYDGVIVKTDPFNMHALGAVLKGEGLPFNKRMYRNFFLGRTLKEGFSGYLDAVDRRGELEKFIEKKRSFDSGFCEWVKGYDDALTFIKKVRGKFRLAITSGTRKIFSDQGLKKIGLKNVFELIVTAEDYNKGKPDPEAYIKTLGLLGIPPKEAVVIEDSPLGVKAAKLAGIFCIAVTHTHTVKELREADLVVDNFKKVHNYLLNLHLKH